MRHVVLTVALLTSVTLAEEAAEKTVQTSENKQNTAEVTIEEFRRFKAESERIHRATEANNFDRADCLKLTQTAKAVFSPGKTIKGEVRKAIDGHSVGSRANLNVSRLFGTWPPEKRWYYSIHIEYSQDDRDGT